MKEVLMIKQYISKQITLLVNTRSITMIRLHDTVKFLDLGYSNTLRVGTVIKIEFDFFMLEKFYWIECNNKVYKLRKNKVFEVKKEKK